MKLSTSSNIVCERPSGSNYTLEQTLEVACLAGFDTFDISFFDWSLPFSPFLTDGWRAWIESVAEAAARLGVGFGQCHAYTYDFLNPRYSDEERTYHESLVHRSLKCCAVVGSHLCVTHPDTAWDDARPVRASRQKNVEYFADLLEHASRLGMELALENMCGYAVLPKRQFFVMPEEIADFVDDFDDPRLGVCWDFEHADILGLDQPAALRQLAHRLKATHVSDAASKTYEPLMHVMPFFGCTDWPPIMAALREIGYSGEFCFEAHNYAKRLPEALIPSALRFAFEIGQCLLSM